MAPRNKLLVIQDSTIRAMAAKSEFVKAFPLLRTVANADKSARTCCAGARKRREKQLMMRVKQSLSGLSSAQKKKLKDMLNADQIRITFRRTTGKVVQLTF